MSKAVFILLLSILCSGFIQGAPQKDNKAECENRVSACQTEGSSMTRRPVCGTDNQTYSNRCQLLRAQCLGYPVQIKYRNACSGDSQPCSVSLDYAKSLRRSPHEGGAPFIPKCRADGTYAAVQCHSDTGCWCVTPMGKPIANTAVRNGRPKCGSTGGKSNTRRRSSARGQRNKKGCSRADKTQFNLNLIKEFSSEYDRGRSNPPAQGEGKSRVVIEWKFNEMDKDRNGALQKPEYRELRRLIRKVVKPKRCAKTFARVCDIDHDEIISRQEWSNCISSDGLNYEEVGEHDGELGTPDASEFYDDMSSTVVLPGSLRRVQFPDLEDPIDRKEDSDSVDCLSDRKIVLDEQKNGDTLYVPECTSDGRYQRVQCYHSTGYCWCVHEDTGKPIPGSSVKDQHPRCEALTVINRPMKGCPDQKKTVFIKDLMDFFWPKMVASTNGSVVSGSSDILKWPASKEEQIATWTFVMLDKDKNKILDRREWKIFHNLITVNAQLKRCGKKLPRYCDVNHDRKISITEWLSCLNAQRGAAVNTTTPSAQSTSTSKRKGPNPLEEYLDYE